MTFEDFKVLFEKYVDTFRNAEGVLCDSMQLKYEHTFDVYRYASEIARVHNFSPDDYKLGCVCALFHDVARFIQVKKYSTFDDRRSKFDHGYEGVRILYENNMLAGLDPFSRLTAAVAIELHNKPFIDPKIKEPVLTFVKLTRDADKLAILKILLRYMRGEIRVDDENIVNLGRSPVQGFSPEIVTAALNGTIAYHKYMRSVNDFKLSLYAWTADLNFPASAKIALRENFYNDILEFLPGEPVVKEIAKRAEERLKCLSLK